jgi:hypothetical protein
MAISAAAKVAKALAKASKKKADGIISEDEWIKANPHPAPNKRPKDMSADEFLAHEAWNKRKRMHTREGVRDKSRKSARASHHRHRDKRNAESRDYQQGITRKRQAERAEYEKEHAEEIAAEKAIKKEEQARKKREASARRYKERREELQQAQRDYYKRNVGAHLDRNATRRAAQIQRTPEWSNPESISEIYQAAADVSAGTGVPHEVDHIIPLQGRNVSGLHHQDNLLVVPTSTNRTKGNRFEAGDLPPVGGVEAARSLLEEVLGLQRR